MIKISQGKLKQIHDVQYIPSLAHNLLSVGQLLSCGYSVVFEQEACYIKDKTTGKQMANI